MKVTSVILLIISKKEPVLLDRFAPFSYFFLAFSLFSLGFVLIVWFPSSFSLNRFQLGDRLQVWMVGILVASLIIIGFLSVNYIIRLNTQKNKDNLSDRAYSILVELQHQSVSNETLALDTSGVENIQDLLTRLSNVFFTDVNVFTTNGQLLASSRSQIYEEKLVSDRMNRDAFNELSLFHKPFLLQKERIGTQDYYSAYLPVYNDRNRLLGYLNVPSFASQEDLKKEVSAFLVAFVNSYILIIIIGIFLSLIVSDYIIRPLRMLTGKIGALNLASPVEKLVWKRKDEIGRLVDEYNRMTAELSRSAELLAKSERESAWREMAKQIAHEIKNPLTPMKLSVQHLEKAWRDNAPDWDVRLSRFSKTMIEQIDSLSTISSEFSDFAKMPPAILEKIGINELINTVLNIYSDATAVHFEFSGNEKENYILADRKQMIRVFTNLINNALQAMDESRNGIIKITTVTDGKNCVIDITDNGSGIDPVQAERIFQPNFTTKSSGMGLGLAIVKSIVTETGGAVRFTSSQGAGTTFTLIFPLQSPIQ